MLHETESHLQDERRIIDAVCNKWRCEAVKTSKAYPVDFMLVRDKIPQAFAEVRKRNISRHEWPTFIWSLQKYIHVKQFAQFLPTFLIVEWNEDITWCKLTYGNYDLIYIDRTGKTGRTNADNEPCIQIPLTDFKDLI